MLSKARDEFASFSPHLGRVFVSRPNYVLNVANVWNLQENNVNFSTNALLPEQCHLEAKQVRERQPTFFLGSLARLISFRKIGALGFGFELICEAVEFYSLHRVKTQYKTM